MSYLIKIVFHEYFKACLHIYKNLSQEFLFSIQNNKMKIFLFSICLVFLILNSTVSISVHESQTVSEFNTKSKYIIIIFLVIYIKNSIFSS